MADAGVPFDQIGGGGDDDDTPIPYAGMDRMTELEDSLFSDGGRILSPAELQEYGGLVAHDPNFHDRYPGDQFNSAYANLMRNAAETNQSRIITQSITDRLKAGQVGAHLAPVDPPVPMPPEMQRGSAVQAPTGPSGPGRYHIEIKQVPTNLSPSGRGWSIRQVFDK